MISNITIVDLGTIQNGLVTAGTFILTNDSNHLINIIGTRASCGCTAPSMTKGDMQPSEERNVSISFNSTGKRGNNTKVIYIDYIEDNNQRTFSQTFKCNVT